MKVITGTARGRGLLAPSGREVRPTSQMVKEAVFSMIQFELEQAAFLDLFAGTGQMGIEALSRGASKAYFVDSSTEAMELVRKNLEITGLFKSAQVLNTDARTFLSGTKAVFDIAFLDPPYYDGIIPDILPLLTPKMSPSGVIICETAVDTALAQRVSGFVKTRQSRYGKRMITVFRRENESEE